MPSYSHVFPADLLPEPLRQDVEASRAGAKAFIGASQAAQKKYYDSRRSPAVKYDKGDVVVVKRLPVHTGESTKLQAKFRGPMVIEEILPSDTYKISNLLRGKKRYETTAHADQLKLYRNHDDSENAAEVSDDQSSCSSVEPVTPRPKRQCKPPDRYGW